MHSNKHGKEYCIILPNIIICASVYTLHFAVYSIARD